MLKNGPSFFWMGEWANEKYRKKKCLQGLKGQNKLCSNMICEKKCLQRSQLSC